MEAADDALERYRNVEIPTGPWEEDENEDCAAYHSDVFRMFLMKVLPAPLAVGCCSPQCPSPFATQR